MEYRARRLHLNAATHTGRVRPLNQDAYALLHACHTAVLADGLGGGPAGEVAAAMAVQVIEAALPTLLGAVDKGAVSPQEHEQELLQREQALRSAVGRANAAIHQHGHTKPNCAGMGTTLVLAHWFGSHLLVGHVGDSRAYRLRSVHWPVGGHLHHRYLLQALTRDHSASQEETDARWRAEEPLGTTSRSHAPPPKLTRALGVEPDVVLELHRHRLDPDDVVLLCSDGLTDLIEDDKIQALFQDATGMVPATPQGLDGANQALLKAALDAGGTDNITVLLGLQAPFHRPSAPPSPPGAR